MQSQKTQPKHLFLENPVRIAQQIWPEGTVPVVSVFSWVFDHAEFIRQSIESIINQKTSFPVEVIIHDDASTDGTTQIISEYQKQYPQLFRNILQKENQWSQGKCVVRPLFEIPRGDYIALAHGDDYWIDSKKLETQFRYLQENQECVACFHNSRLVDDKNNVLKDKLYDYDQSKYDMLEAFAKLRSRYSTSSLFFKNIFGEINLPEWFLKKPNDMAIEILLSQYGSFGCINENLSDYRMHGGGVWSKLSEEIKYFELMYRLQSYIDDKEFPNKLKPIARSVFLELLETQPHKYLIIDLEYMIADLERRLRFSANEIKNIKSSFSWQLTKPLRKIHNLFLKGIGKEGLSE
jgi:glycosyltransferase involved in cell wall biosynthesis